MALVTFPEGPRAAIIVADIMTAASVTTAAPRASTVLVRGGTFVVETWTDAAPGRRLVFLHGWGQDRRAMAPLAAGFTTGAECLLIDQPGFGAAPPPPGPPEDAWGTEDYAEALAEWLATDRKSVV